MENKTVLDFGCGTGANCSIFKPSFYLGIEPDVKRVELANRLYPNHRFVSFKENRIPVQNDSIDLIFIVAVLHHIDDEQIKRYLLEFERVLKPAGKIIVMEPYLCDRTKWNNRFMNWYDDGEYIRNENSYLNLFQAGQYECQVLKRFTKCFLYNELFFTATPKNEIPSDHFTHEAFHYAYEGGDLGDSFVPS
ncbi:class I SAM-dependent methyltransferase [Paenibacillus mendelii]|uniref:Class I SAM-dependent methyltransferase n=1 Tax=Paenibacillus mendelii TaxID=206163 RepID=A0ABV6JEK0_9BACL|nr:class I SAM-dependent methyltransferase [Paenibacillus mendelii]MCQ6557198.1 class I SAM-dependent methyltransferase [Paenibacillus mendelii]